MEQTINGRGNVRFTFRKHAAIILRAALQDWNSRNLIVHDTLQRVRKNRDTGHKELVSHLRQKKHNNIVHLSINAANIGGEVGVFQ